MITVNITTSGPCFMGKKFDNISAMVAFVERGMYLKKGWTIRREFHPDNPRKLRFRKFNSNGRLIDSHGVWVTITDGPSAKGHPAFTVATNDVVRRRRPGSKLRVVETKATAGCVTLATAIRNESFVTIETIDGDVYIGVVKPVSFDKVEIVTGMRGRPVVLDIDDIDEIRIADNRNPHVA